MPRTAVPPYVEYVEIVLDRLTHRKQALVRDIAAALGCSSRTLERGFRLHGYPGPREMLDWCRLALTAALAEFAGESVTAAGRRIRLDANTLLRLKKRRLPRAAYRTADDLRDPSRLLDVTITAFATRLACGRGSDGRMIYLPNDRIFFRRTRAVGTLGGDGPCFS